VTYIPRVSDEDRGRPAICPYFGIAGDPSSHYSFPEGAHRCHAKRDARPIDLVYQANTCMRASHVHCPAYRSGLVARAPSRIRRAGTLLVRLGAVAALTIGVLLAVALSRAIIEGPPGAIAEPSDGGVAIPPTAPPLTSSPFVTTAPTAPSRTPTDQPTASATATASPTPRPSEPASPNPTATAIVHIVQPGESVWYLAELYGVSRRAIVEANRLENRHYIEVGQRLLIPPPQP
jgi:LysM repeat protein